MHIYNYVYHVQFTLGVYCIYICIFDRCTVLIYMIYNIHSIICIIYIYLISHIYIARIMSIYSIHIMSTHIETIYIYMCRIWIFAKIFDPFDGDEIRHVWISLPGYLNM